MDSPETPGENLHLTSESSLASAWETIQKALNESDVDKDLSPVLVEAFHSYFYAGAGLVLLLLNAGVPFENIRLEYNRFKYEKSG